MSEFVSKEAEEEEKICIYRLIDFQSSSKIQNKIQIEAKMLRMFSKLILI